MVQIMHSLGGLEAFAPWIAQSPVVSPPVTTPERAASIFSGPQFFIALIAGVVLAFAFQLLLTNLGVGAALSMAGGDDDRSASHHTDEEDASFGGTIRKIGLWVGLGTLISVTISLFVACLLAVRLSLLQTDLLMGATIGLVIWATFFLLMFWASSSTVGSLLGSIVNTATSGLQAIFGTAAAAFGAKAVNQQVVSTAEAAAAAVRRELGAAIDPMSLRETLEDYLGKVRPPELDVANIRQEFERLLKDADIPAIARSGNLDNINRQAFVNLLNDRTDLSKRDINRIVDQLESTWKQAVGQTQAKTQDGLAELVNYLKTAQPNQMRDELNARLDALTEELRASKQQQKQQTEKETPGMLQRTVQSGFNMLTGVVMGRTDLSDLDVQSILNSLSTARDKVAEQSDKVRNAVQGEPEFSPIRADVENYLLNTPSWQMSRERLEREFRNVIYDPEADPSAVRRELERLKREDFVNLLQERGLFTQLRIQEISHQLERIRREVLGTVYTAEAQEKATVLSQRVGSFIAFTPKEVLLSDQGKQDFKDLISDADASHDDLAARLQPYTQVHFLSLLQQRADISPAEAEQIANQLVEAQNRVLIESEDLQNRVKAETEASWLKLESYLRNTGKDELNPDAIKQELKLLLDNPQAGVSALRHRFSRFDRDTLVQVLSQRQDLSEGQVNQIIDQVENNWHSVVHAPQKLADQAKQQYDQTSNAIAEYLRNTGKDELNPEGIQRDLAKLLENPQEGAIALRQRLSHMDRDTLVKLLSQRQDLSEEQVNQIIDQVQDSIRKVIRAPRRLASRTQQQVMDFQSSLEDYLRNTGKDELNPEAIKRDLQLLLNDPRTGMESLMDRLSRIDRETMISLLSQRSDMTEEEAAQTVDQVLAVRDQFVEQVRSIQRRIQDVIDGIFAQIRNYLNSLNRPELNYDGIKRDVRTLFDDPQAGFDALRDRLSHFNRDTLVAIMSSREDISQADANRIIDQIEGARTTVIQRAERLQQEAQRRLDEVKYQAQRQADETRKAAATASWWLFGTATISAIAAAIGGMLAVTST